MGPFVVMVTIVMAVYASACTTDTVANPAAMCSFVVGDGKDGRGAEVKKVAWPDQNSPKGTNEVTKYVPCNSRNFIVNDGTVFNANQQKVGDRFTPTLTYTSTGKPVNVYWSAYWTLNQDEDTLRKFYELCHKYECYSTDSSSGAANFSTPGWNGMLGENFGTAGDQALFAALSKFDDAIWEDHSAELYEQLGTEVSNLFAEKVRVKTGYELDLFCGSGNSGWPDPKKPNEGQFNCTNVRFVIDRVESADPKLQEQQNEQTAAEKAMEANAQKLAAAQAIYGDYAPYWLGLQDTLARCNEQTTCVINIGEPGSIPVVGIDPTATTQSDGGGS